MKEKLYDLPKYYDIAFSWDISFVNSVCKMEIIDLRNRIVFEERHILRLWFFEDLKSLISKLGRSKFKKGEIMINKNLIGRCGFYCGTKLRDLNKI